MRLLALLLVLVGFATSAQACPACRPAVEASVYSPGFVGTALVLLLPLLVIGLVGAAIHAADRKGPSPRNDG